MKEAMKQALEALEDAKTHGLVYVNEIVDLRQAIAEAKEQGEPVAKLFGTLPVYDTTPPRENT
jgi:hypothetical protein